ncbi:uncharacterized protein SCHCODRAFT_0237750 [Schizophyllum commune H4-8]|uniref:RBR-type E3 ubiquitin transferase n=1 Tax=Schizophyllum commune (strain H4-8 / FGSC 9210) TaxID=578458 RepID=D8QH31_SCHCM|nr:uncharacterized protein SCHCODRAFT_0237750 [Schizophyllum commune H4-8]KAI5887001.1 hypothetical protein SCHCODRAFT_0237750 [Schizophyllum commune H4-8]
MDHRAAPLLPPLLLLLLLPSITAQKVHQISGIVATMDRSLSDGDIELARRLSLQAEEERLAEQRAIDLSLAEHLQFEQIKEASRRMAAPPAYEPREVQPPDRGPSGMHSDDGKGKGRMYGVYSMPEPEVQCGICFDDMRITNSPIAASASANTSDALPFGLRLPCPAEHQYCITCLTRHIMEKLDPQHNGRGAGADATVFPIPCPGCATEQGAPAAEIPDDVARRILTADDMRLWDWQKWVENAEFKMYCPNPSCSALILEAQGPKAKCWSCGQKVCVACKAPWHKGATCEAQQIYRLLATVEQRNSKDEDRKFFELAKAKGWQQCPKCKRMVELKEGCNHMTCRCSAEFCYKCGSFWDVSAGRCTKRNPSCTFADEYHVVNEPDDTGDARPGGHPQFPAGAPYYPPHAPQYAAYAPNTPGSAQGYARHTFFIPPDSPPFSPGAPVVPNAAPPSQGPPVIPLDGFYNVYRPAESPFIPHQMYEQPRYYYGYGPAPPPW